MKKLVFLLCLALTSSFTTFAQSYKEGNLFGFTVNAGSGQFANALSWSHYHGIGKSKRIKVGYGIRLTNHFGSDLDYVTAPAKYTSGHESIVALFSDDIIKNFDTVRFSSPQFNFLNLGIYLAYTPPILKNKLDLGVNIDAVGFSFGASQVGKYNNSQSVTARPTTLNALLVSDSDYGSLNSEWYVRYWLNNRWAIKGGYEFLFTEYTTDSKVQAIPGSSDRNDRFRNKARMVMFGIEFAPFRK
ncbi:MAG: hypothetical protein V4714_23000 [Bacteroidota bacterium]